MATKVELRNQVLEYLGRKIVGQSPQTKDEVDIEQAIDEVYADLQSDKIMSFGAAGAVPNDVLPHIKALVAFRRSSGLSPERFQRVAQDAGLAKREIRRLVAPLHTPIDWPVDY